MFDIHGAIPKKYCNTNKTSIDSFKTGFLDSRLYSLFYSRERNFLTPHIYRKKNILQKKKKSSYVRFESSKQLSFFLSRITSHLTHLTYQSIFSSIVFSLRTLLMCCFAKLREYKIVQVVLDLVKFTLKIVLLSNVSFMCLSLFRFVLSIL